MKDRTVTAANIERVLIAFNAEMSNPDMEFEDVYESLGPSDVEQRLCNQMYCDVGYPDPDDGDDEFVTSWNGWWSVHVERHHAAYAATCDDDSDSPFHAYPVDAQ